MGCWCSAFRDRTGPRPTFTTLLPQLVARSSAVTRFATGAPQALPPGLPPVLHAAAFFHIAGGEPQLPDDFDWALRLATGQIEGMPLPSVRKWRTAKLRLLKRLVARGEALGLAQYFESLRSSSSARVASHTHPSRTALAMASLGGRTLTFPCLWRRVRPCLGMPYSGIFRSGCVIADTTLAELLDGAARNKRSPRKRMVVTQKSQWTPCCKPERSEVTTRSTDPKMRS